MKRFRFLQAIAALLMLPMLMNCAKTEKIANDKRIYMWVDCEANFARMSTADSIAYYTEKMQSIGVTDIVVDVKSIMGETLYDSKYAPYMGEFEGTVRPREYDMMRHFIDEGHKHGMRVHGSLNIFAGGHNFFGRGIIYNEHPEWQSIVYQPDGSLVPISEIKTNYNGMLNPSNPEVREYQKNILVEFVERYPDADGIIFDRLRYDNMTSDFSELSRQQFEAWSGLKVEKFPEDILTWADEKTWKPAKYFKQWVEWRATIIKSFVEEAHAAIHAANPNILIGDYTGAWYPTYYQLGVNWASTQYNPAERYPDWASENYYKTGYAELLDIYMTGLYYTLVTKDEVDAAQGRPIEGERGEAGMDPNDLTYCYSVEGGAELAQALTCGVVPVVGSLYVDQYKEDSEQFAKAVRQVMKSCEGGLMIFDLVHIVNRDWWALLEENMKCEE
ncbi:MAG: S-layer protein [Rikenellaceae bacterium]|nr:S-layer protein [Rikenellaceae bacterium]